MTRLRCNVCWEKFACDRTNDVLFSLEHVIEMSKEKASGKRQVCAVHIFNWAKSPQERPVEKNNFGLHGVGGNFFFFHTKWIKPAMKC